MQVQKLHCLSINSHHRIVSDERINEVIINMNKKAFVLGTSVISGVFVTILLSLFVLMLTGAVTSAIKWGFIALSVYIIFKFVFGDKHG